MNRITLLKKGGIMLIGLAAMTKEKADKVAKDLEKRGMVTANEAKAIAKKLVHHAMEEKKKIRKEVLVEIKKSVKTVLDTSMKEAYRIKAEMNKKPAKPKKKAAPKKKKKKKVVKKKKAVKKKKKR